MIYLLILISLLLTLILVALVNTKDMINELYKGTHAVEDSKEYLKEYCNVPEPNKKVEDAVERNIEQTVDNGLIIPGSTIITKPKKRWKQSIDTTIWMERFEAMLADKEKRLVSDNVVFADHKIDKSRWRNIATEAQKKKLVELQGLVKTKSRKEVKKSFNYGKKV